MNIISTLCDPTPSYLASAETKLINGSIEQTEQKKEVIIILDSDDEDESTAGYQQLTPENEEKVTPEKKQQLTPEKSKQLIQSEWTGTLTTCAATKGIDEVIETTLGRDQNSRIAPYGQSAALMTWYPWSSYQPSAHFERVILHERPEEERKQDLAVCTSSLLAIVLLNFKFYTLYYLFLHA
jgi:hypothetical protein